MKKFILIIFISLIAFIMYQFVLGENGILESYKVKLIRNEINDYKLTLEKIKNDKAKIKNEIKNSVSLLNESANDAGFYKEPDKKIIKVIDESIEATDDIYLVKNQKNKSIYSLNNAELTKIENNINKYKIIMNIIFFLVIGIFFIIIILGKEEWGK